MDEAFTLARSSHRGPGLRRRTDGRVLQLLDRHRRLRRGHPHRARRRRDRGGRPAAGRGPPAGADPRHRRLGRPRRGRRAALRRGPRHPDPDQRHGPRRDPRRAPLAGHQGPRRRAVRAPTWWSSSAPRSTSASATAPSAAPTRTPTGAFARVVHIADSPGQVSGHAELAGSVSGDLTTVLDGLQAALERGEQARLDDVVRPARRPGARRPPSATPSCSPPRPTRSTRPASTASWSPGSTTTRS